MDGAAEAKQAAYDLALAQAWHTEAFAREKRLKKLSAYQTRSEKRSAAADAVAFFHGLKAKGYPVDIKRVVH